MLVKSFTWPRIINSLWVEADSYWKPAAMSLRHYELYSWHFWRLIRFSDSWKFIPVYTTCLSVWTDKHVYVVYIYHMYMWYTYTCIPQIHIHIIWSLVTTQPLDYASIIFLSIQDVRNSILHTSYEKYLLQDLCFDPDHMLLIKSIHYLMNSSIYCTFSLEMFYRL